MTQPAATRLRRVARRTSTVVVSLALGVVGALAVSQPASAAVSFPLVLEVESGVTAGGPALNSGEHGNFSGTGSYTFREAGMRSTMQVNGVTAAQAGTYPVWIRYAAGVLSPAEPEPRTMGLITNGARQQVQFPSTGDWETWRFVRAADITLVAGDNTIAVDCARATSGTNQETCRLNFDAVQIGGTAPDLCAATPTAPGAAALFDGTFASFDQWRKAGGGGFGRQADCTLRGFRGAGTTWTSVSPAQMAGPYTLRADWRRGTSEASSSIYVGSTSNNAATPTGGYQVMIGADDSATVRSGAFSQAADATALATAVKPAGQWNRFAVQVTPQRIRVLLNDTVVNTVDRAAAMGGFVGLENRTAAPQVDFRDIQVVPGVELGRLSGPARRATLANGTTANPGGESTLGHLVADAQRWATRTSTAGTARIALASPTALQSDLAPAGTSVTYAEAASVVAAEGLVNMRLTGAQLKTVLEQQWQRAGTSGPAPTRTFVRLGASAGFTWTQDATRPLDDRITGMWLDGVAIVPTGTYSVTAGASLAAGGDNFHELAKGTGRRTPEGTTVSALTAYLGDRSAAAVLAVPRAQAAVDVHVPGGAPTSYVAGTTYAVDLASWSYSAASDPVDSAVTVTVGRRSIGSFPVDNTRADDPSDLHGRVTVRATLPVDLAAGRTTVRIVGDTTGTTVQQPIVVTAAPVAPTPDPTPSPTPDPTPGPTPAPPVVTAPYLPPSQAAPTKAASRLKVKVRPGKVLARKTRARLVVSVATSGAGSSARPTGKVRVRVGTKTVTRTLRRGKVTLRLPVFREAGTSKVTIRYVGDASTLSVSRTMRIRAVAR
ncbi:5'-nucleotidase C-terminal domain-containing protein [Nocardioides hwasunensis]|uniref:5'-nucleotidase C-terminal domain-containing protein n=1 Tax=Nocardioides hwasunensis TaxID=397258 RepID=A0ABR8MLX4_9ACTN|nr:5'-nucleotidase C-terminal domain-containing protein [Nocardioides hwasunensis]MBD3916261.1 5'-nucleotidase C-terminal domain-containing protein [Nocardioides hwasunensis]